MSSEAAVDLPDDPISVLTNHDIEAITLKDGTYIRIRQVTSVNETLQTVRVIPRQGSARVIPISDISEIARA